MCVYLLCVSVNAALWIIINCGCKINKVMIFGCYCFRQSLHSFMSTQMNTHGFVDVICISYIYLWKIWILRYFAWLCIQSCLLLKIWYTQKLQQCQKWKLSYTFQFSWNFTPEFNFIFQHWSSTSNIKSCCVIQFHPLY